MSYKLQFKKSALKEWKKLGHNVREQFKKKLADRLENPHIPQAALTRMPNTYKIKLAQLGYRLVYTVQDDIVTVTVIAIGKRNRNEVYDVALARARKEEP